MNYIFWLDFAGVVLQRDSVSSAVNLCDDLIHDFLLELELSNVFPKFGVVRDIFYLSLSPYSS